MKTLTLLRHSKAGQTNKNISDDHDRQLTAKGLELCEKLAAYMQEKDYLPQHVICSTAVRTRATAEQLFSHWGKTPSIDYVSSLYLATQSDILEVIQSISNSKKDVMLIGHNPGLHQCALHIAGEGDRVMYRHMKNLFPPASFARYECPQGRWEDVAMGSLTLTDTLLSGDL